jgi:hypothetical protein
VREDNAPNSRLPDLICQACSPIIDVTSLRMLLSGIARPHWLRITDYVLSLEDVARPIEFSTPQRLGRGCTHALDRSGKARWPFAGQMQRCGCLTQLSTPVNPLSHKGWPSLFQLRCCRLSNLERMERLGDPTRGMGAKVRGRKATPSAAIILGPEDGGAAFKGAVAAATRSFTLLRMP